MLNSSLDFVPFLLRAKKATYASGTAETQAPSSRPASHDLTYAEDELSYIDSYLGGYAFLGEEALWKRDEAGEKMPLWGMNYYGTMVGLDTTPAGLPAVPDGFGDFLKLALRHVPAHAPYRGPAEFAEGRYRYTCHWEGDLDLFHGEESIALDDQVIYRLYFHGGSIL